MKLLLKLQWYNENKQGMNRMLIKTTKQVNRKLNRMTGSTINSNREKKAKRNSNRVCGHNGHMFCFSTSNVFLFASLLYLEQLNFLSKKSFSFFYLLLVSIPAVIKTLFRRKKCCGLSHGCFIILI